MPRIMYIVAIMLCTAVVLTGCGSDDDNPLHRVSAQYRLIAWGVLE